MKLPVSFVIRRITFHNFHILYHFYKLYVNLQRVYPLLLRFLLPDLGGLTTLTASFLRLAAGKRQVPQEKWLCPQGTCVGSEENPRVS